MFRSAVIRLTSWYILILMSISLLFSLTIYNVTTAEIRDRLSDLQVKLEQRGLGSVVIPKPNFFTSFEQDQYSSAERSIFLTLLYVNLIILSGGGALCHILARRSMASIERAHEAQSRFTSDASHEMRTPLAAMKAELEVALRAKKLTMSEMREILESNLEEVDKLASMSQTLLHLSRLDYVNLDIKRIDMHKTTAEIIQKYDKNANRIHIDLPQSPLYIQGNQASIDELITILVDNALKYSTERTKINATLMKKGKNILFVISNEGKNIPADKLPHIFKRFYRVDASRNTQGTGLGLALAKEIVNLHGGNITASSTPGKRTIFTVSLPAKKK